MIFRGIIFVGFLFTSLSTFAQSGDSVSVQSESSLINCFQRPKFLELNYRTLPAVKAYPHETSYGNEDYEGNHIIESKLSIPIVLKSKFNLISQIRYKNEELNLGENDYFDREITFNNTNITFLYQWFYKENHFIAGHLSAGLKADRYDAHYFSSMLDYNTSFLVGRETGEKMMAAGVMYSNSLQRHRALPVLVYKNRLGFNWHIDAYIPKELTVARSLVHDDLYLTFTLEGNGASYFIHDNTLEEFPAVEFRRRAIDFRLGLEKEIRDWVWLGFYAGASQPLRSILIKNGEPSRRYIHDFDQKLNPFASFSLFLVPPRAMYNRLSK